MNQMKNASLIDDLKKIKKKKILVIGDVMLDTYYQGTVKRISPEAPVPVFKKKGQRHVPGGAANVAVNLAAAGQDVSVMAVVGEDAEGDVLINELYKLGVHTDMLIRSKRSSTTKIRFMAENNQQVLRLDIEDDSELNTEEEDSLLCCLQEKIADFDLLVMSDYLKGLLTYDFTQKVIKTAHKESLKVLVDVKDVNAEKYKGAFLVKPNLSELCMLTKRKADTDEEIIQASEYLRDKCEAQYVLTTCGARGMILVGQDCQYSVDSVGKEVFDVTGAGDTTIAYLAACIANGIGIERAVDISNIAAGVQVAKVGTSAVRLQETVDFAMQGKQTIVHKLLQRDEIDRFRERYGNKKIVFTNGCFDILHVGHIRYLQEAAKMGDILVIGLNSDTSVKRLKGENRPINTERDRAELLCSLECVDFVVLFEEDTPYELIQRIQPDVLVKGGDYRPEDVVGRDIVEARGGRLELIDFVEGKSTTGIIEQIKG